MPKTSDTEYLSFPILLGDIGGTNARFSILIDSFAEPVHLTTVKTAEYPTIDDAKFVVTVPDGLPRCGAK